MHSWIKNFNNKRHLCKTISLIKISSKAYTCFMIYCIPHSENTEETLIYLYEILLRLIY